MPDLEIIVLGTGTSHGVPMIGCDCQVCTSDDPRDKRTRPSIFVCHKELHILIDTTPELRLQCIANQINRVDAVLFTHHHADHVAGLDDLRRFNWLTKKSMPCYGTKRTLDALRRMFLYAFEHAPDSPHSRPHLTLHELDGRPFEIAGHEIIPIPLLHGPMPVLGFRFGKFAYCTDCSIVPDDSRSLLHGVEVLILDALRHDTHPTHMNLSQAVETAQRIGASRTYFTHMAHQLKHADTNAMLPDGMELAYDGLRIEI
ncbi:MAG: MBL fold metallo-hydrolase [Planctomycetes bacterium]|nr:MBL fold metallo-hydrolase [Planctomycetota bacterium]MBI3835617.1 MBL fold metallo-hydrolase [Planctomycetota bacterium]